MRGCISLPRVGSTLACLSAEEAEESLVEMRHRPTQGAHQQPNRRNPRIHRDLRLAASAVHTRGPPHVRLDRSVARCLLVRAIVAVVQANPIPQRRCVGAPLCVLERRPPEVHHSPQRQPVVLACHVERSDPSRGEVLLVPAAPADGPLGPPLQRVSSSDPLTDEAIQVQLGSRGLGADQVGEVVQRSGGQRDRGRVGQQRGSREGHLSWSIACLTGSLTRPRALPRYAPSAAQSQLENAQWTVFETGADSVELEIAGPRAAGRSAGQDAHYCLVFAAEPQALLYCGAQIEVAEQGGGQQVRRSGQ